MSDFKEINDAFDAAYKMRMSEMFEELSYLREARGACCCGDSTALGVIHSSTRPCHLPMVYMPLTDDQIKEIAKLPETDLEFARAIENAHGIGGINEV
jgi:hypothetical protein